MNKFLFNRFFILVSFLFAFYLVGCRSTQIDMPQSSNPVTTSPIPKKVSVIKIEPSSMANSNKVIPTTISSKLTIPIFAESDGVLIQLNVTEGQLIKKGELLAKIENNSLLQRKKEAELEVNRLKIDLEGGQVQLDVTRKELEQETALFQAGLTSKRQLERAQLKKEAAQQDLEKQRITLTIAETKVEELASQVKNLQIFSPISGIVSHTFVNSSAKVSINEKIFEISDPSSLEIKVDIPLSIKERFQINSQYDLLLPNENLIVGKAKVKQINSVLSKENNSIKVIADVHSDHQLALGMTINLMYQEAESKTIWVPKIAFLAEVVPDKNNTLMLLSNNSCAARTVLVGRIEGDQIEVSSGLNKGDLVILSPLSEIKIGDFVIPAPSL